MKNKRTLVIALWAMFISIGAIAQKGNEQQLEKDANALFKAGEYLKAYPLYSQLLALYPSHADYNYKFGACAIYSDPDKTKAVKFLTIATSKALDDAMAWYYLGKAYHLNYQFKDAIKAYEQFIRKADPKTVAKTDAQRSIETCIYGSNLLANIKDIDVISKTDADKSNFFRYFNLEEVGGKILTVPDELKSSLDKKSKETGVMHYPAGSTTIYFSSYGKDGATGKDIYKASVLPNGKFSAPEKIKGEVNTKYDEDYCFMHSDGKTLYFASKGHNSMGGYDIFKSIYDPETDSFGPAINMDFAINTPDDDIFYITDSLNQRAYFASGRSSDLNHLSVYNVMVQGNPLQVVYLKGEFFSEIDNEQKAASLKVVDPNNNRIVCESKTNSAGNYVIYVPRSGEYVFKVTTENSSTVHEQKVNVPLFDKPVALRQEMRLVMEQGREKIIFRNHFDTPLNEDLASLAAEMLRKKSSLDANISVEEAMAKAAAPAANAHALEPTMENAPLAAGFANGISVKSVVSDMEMELANIKKFVAESDQKRNNSMAYALKKQKEADVALSKAEAARKTVGGYTSNEDVEKLRESHAYTIQAEQLQREAKAAINAAESVTIYKEREAQRAEELDNKIRVIRQAESTQNFDAAVAALKEEKQRKNAQDSGEEASPFTELSNKARAKESELHKAEKNLSDLRTREKSLEVQVKVLQERINNSTKKADRQAAEAEYTAEVAELDKVRRSIITQNENIKKLGEETKLAMANVEVYKRLASDTGMGLTAAEKRTLSDAERTALTMKLDQMSNRIDALEITDAKTLAMVTEGGSDNNSVLATTSGSGSGSMTVKSGTPAPNLTATSSGSNGGGATQGNQTLYNNGKGSTANYNAQAIIPAASLKNEKEQAVLRTGNSVAMAPTRTMYVAASLEQTNQQIFALENKKAQGSLATAESKELTDLVKLRGELQQDLAKEKTAPMTLSSQEFNSTVSSYIPSYVSDVNVATARGNNDVERTAQKFEYKQSAIEQLKAARVANAKAAMTETDEAKIATYTQKDKQLEGAIAQLTKENGNIQQFTSSYEKESKAIQSNASATADSKSQAQAKLNASYTQVLDKAIAVKAQELSATVDAQQTAQLQQELQALKTEKARVATQMDTYAQNATQAGTTSTKGSSAAGMSVSLEDELEREGEKLADARSQKDEKVEERVARDAKAAEKIFKPRVESESIFAYESGIFEDIAKKHAKDDNLLKNREQIAEFNNQIFLIEGEMENVENERALRKLDYQAEQLYLKRSLIEIENSPAIARMAAKEYEEADALAKEMTKANREKIDSRIMIKDEVTKLERQAKANMEEAAELRKKSPSLHDDIERADNDRQAFAKEALAIEQLRQIQDINNNIDMLLVYTDLSLAELKTGTIPKEFREMELAAKNAGTVDNADTSELMAASGTSANSVNATQGGSSSASGNSATGSDSISATNNSAVSNEAVAANGSSKSTDNATSAGNVSSTAATQSGSTTGNSSTAKGFTSADQLASNATTGNGSTGSNAGTSSNGTSTTNNLSGTSSNGSDVADNTSYTAAGNTKSGGVSGAVSSQDNNVVTSTSSQGGSNGSSSNATSTDGNVAVAANATNSSAGRGADNSGSTSNTSGTNAVTVNLPPSYSAQPSTEKMAMASDHFYAPPKSLTSDIFSRTNRAVYNNSHPIPVDAEMPSGIYYKVQVGAFRNDIPQNLYDEFAPITGERVGNGVTRYTAGFFMNFENADAVKREIRAIGYGDAFVVAYKDGKRIPLYEAMGKTEGDNMMAAVEKEYVYGDKGEAPKSNVKSTPKASAPAPAKSNNKPANNNNGSIIYTASHNSNANVSDYYAGFPEAAKATKVEATQGMFFTVQVGVYSRPVPAKSMHYINPLNSELTDTKKIRYTSGMYTSLQEAVDKRTEARTLGITDAFVTAYYNGQRISLSEADRLLKEKGNGILITKGIN